MAPKTYRIKIVRGDQQLEAEGDRAFVVEMVRRFDEPGRVVPSRRAAQSAGPAAVASSKVVSIGEFIRNYGFKKHTDLVLAFGYYLEKHSGRDSFTAADISKCYYEAKMETSNVSQSIVQNIRRGFIMAAKGGSEKVKKTFTLTQTGERHIEKFASKTEGEN